MSFSTPLLDGPISSILFEDNGRVEVLKIIIIIIIIIVFNTF